MSRKSKLVTDANGYPIQGALCPNGTAQNVAVGVASALSTLLATGAEIVRLVSTTNCHIKFGGFGTVVALATDMFLPANVPEYFALRSNKYVAVIRDTADGVLNIQIME